MGHHCTAKWNFGHCLGAIDGKHVIMQAPARSGSYFFNYQKTHSIVLIAVVNFNYEFTLIDIGDAGRQGGGDVLQIVTWDMLWTKNY